MVTSWSGFMYFDLKNRANFSLLHSAKRILVAAHLPQVEIFSDSLWKAVVFIDSFFPDSFIKRTTWVE